MRRIILSSKVQPGLAAREELSQPSARLVIYLECLQESFATKKEEVYPPRCLIRPPDPWSGSPASEFPVLAVKAVYYGRVDRGSSVQDHYLGCSDSCARSTVDG